MTPPPPPPVCDGSLESAAAVGDAWTSQKATLALVAVAILLALVQVNSLVARLQWLARGTHSCGPAPLPPRKDATHARFFQSATTRLWVYHRTWPATTPAARGVVYLLHGCVDNPRARSHVGLVATHAPHPTPRHPTRAHAAWVSTAAGTATLRRR